MATTGTQADLVVNPGLWFSDVSFVDNLAALFDRNSGIFMWWLVNSGIYPGVGALAGTLVAGMAGHVFALPLFPMLSNLQLTNLMLPDEIDRGRLLRGPKTRMPAQHGPGTGRRLQVRTIGRDGGHDLVVHAGRFAEHEDDVLAIRGERGLDG